MKKLGISWYTIYMTNEITKGFFCSCWTSIKKYTPAFLVGTAVGVGGTYAVMRATTPSTVTVPVITEELVIS